MIFGESRIFKKIKLNINNGSYMKRQEDNLEVLKNFLSIDELYKRNFLSEKE